MTEPTHRDELARTTEPVAPVTAVAVSRPGPSLARIAIVAMGLVAVLAGAAMTFASSRPAGTTALTTSSGATVAANGLDSTALAFDGAGPGHRFGFGDITITDINGSNLSLKTADGWTRTIAVASGTMYSKAGATIALADLKVGDQIRFEQTRQTDGSYTIDAIAVVLPHLGGKVTAISGSTITVEQRDGTSGTIKVTAGTTYGVGDNASAALSDIAVGQFVVAEGATNSDGSLNAARVISRPDGPGGHWHLDGPAGTSNSSTNG